MGAALGEIIVSMVAGGGLVVAGIALIIVTKTQMKRYGHDEGEVRK